MFLCFFLIFLHQGPLQDQRASVGGFLLFPCSQSDKARAWSGGKATPKKNLRIYTPWNEGYTVFLLQIKDDKQKCTLGILRVPLSNLLSEEDMTLAQCFPLKNSGPSSTIKLKMTLRVRTDFTQVLSVCLSHLQLMSPTTNVQKKPNSK